MGETCCSGRSKAVQFERTRESTETLYVAKRTRKLSSASGRAEETQTVKYYEQGNNQLEYNLRGPADFSTEEENAFSLVFLRYRVPGQKQEVAVTTGDCYELSILGQREPRRILVSTFAVYLCHSTHLPNVTWRAQLSHLYFISLSENFASAVLHAEAPGTDVWIAGTLLEDILKAIEKVYFELNLRYLPSETVTIKGGLRYRINNLDSAFRSSVKSESSIRTATIVVRFGHIGESRHFSQECTTEKSTRKRRCEFLLTNKAVYTLFPSKVERIALTEITAVKFLAGKVTVSTDNLERSWKLPANIADEIQKKREAQKAVLCD